MASVLSLCTGTGQLERALALAGVNVELVAVADPDPGASRYLAHHHPDVPNLGDITAIDWTRAPRADVLTAGYPCQGFSLAGQRLGENDDRFIWPYVFAAIRDLRPGTVVLENVPGHLSLGFGRVVGDLAAIGYVGSWRCVRASDVGAPHRRNRVFILAWPAEQGGPSIAADVARGLGGAVASAGDLSLLPTPAATRSGRQRSASAGAAIRPSLDMVTALLPTPTSQNAHGNTVNNRGDLLLPGVVQSLLPTPTVGDSRGSRNATANRTAPKPTTQTQSWTLSDVAHADRWGIYAAAIDRWEQVLGRPAPTATEEASKGRPRLSARFVEWLMGLEDGEVCDVPSLSRAEQLRLLGNGIVRLQGAEALRQLVGVS